MGITQRAKRGGKTGPRGPYKSKGKLPNDVAMKLKQRHEEGATIASLAKEMGVHYHKVARTICRVGGKIDRSRKYWTNEERAHIAKMYSDGRSIGSISRELGCAQPKIAKVIALKGVPKRVNKGATHWRWKDGRWIDNHGYVILTREGWSGPPFPEMFDSGGRASEHRLVMAKTLGRALLNTETVHHINGVRSDNRPENLQLRQGQHGRGQVLQCRCCGSEDIGHAPIAVPPMAREGFEAGLMSAFS